MAFKATEDKQYEEMFNAFKKNGSKETAKLEGQVRAGGGTFFKEGDIIEFPEDMKFLKSEVRPKSGRFTSFTIAKITNGSEVRYQPFYPSTLTKMHNVVEVDEEGKIVTRSTDRNEGKVCDDYRACANLGADDSFRKIVAKGAFKITAIKPIHVSSFDDPSVAINSNKYTIDYAA